MSVREVDKVGPPWHLLQPILREVDDPALYARVQEQNLLQQYDLLTNCIEIGLSKGIEAFDKYTLWSLNAAAVANIAQFGGRFREQPSTSRKCPS